MNKPIGKVSGWYGGHPVIEPIDGWIPAVGTMLYSAPLSARKPVYQISLTNGPAKAAWIDVDEATYYSAKMDATYMARCLYAAPPARQPLKEEVK